MHTLLARDLMSTEVVAVPAPTPIWAVARILAERGISAVPVLGEDGRVLGVVTEADLIHRLAGEEEKPASWLASLFRDRQEEGRRWARTHGLHAADVMTAGAATVGPDTRASEVAAIMERRGVRRVLVMEGDRLLGLVSRADLLRALMTPVTADSVAPDARIREAVVAEMRRLPWARSFHTLVEVKEGVVEFHGFSSGEGVMRGLVAMAEAIPGVRAARDLTQPMPKVIIGGV